MTGGRSQAFRAWLAHLGLRVCSFIRHPVFFILHLFSAWPASRKGLPTRFSFIRYSSSVIFHFVQAALQPFLYCPP
jgi:hypothetical protein